MSDNEEEELGFDYDDDDAHEMSGDEDEKKKENSKEDDDEEREEDEEEDEEEDDDEEITDTVLTKEQVDDTPYSVVVVKRRITSNYISKNELARVLSIHASHIAKTGISFTECNSSDPEVRAVNDLKEKKIPLIVRRHLTPKGVGILHVEDWAVNEMSYNPEYIKAILASKK